MRTKHRSLFSILHSCFIELGTSSIWSTSRETSLNWKSIKSSEQHKANPTQIHLHPSIYLSGRCRGELGVPRRSLSWSWQTFVHELLLDEAHPPLKGKKQSVNSAITPCSRSEVVPSFWTHLAGFVCLGVEHAVAEPQAGLLADLLEVRPHGLWKRTLAPSKHFIHDYDRNWARGHDTALITDLNTWTCCLLAANWLFISHYKALLLLDIN